MRTKREMEDARKKFEEEIGKMANAGRALDLQRQAQAVLYGNPYDENGKPNGLSTAAPGAYANSLADLQARFAQVAAKIPANASMAPRDLAEEYNSLSRQIDVLATKYNQLATAARNVKNVAADTPGLLPFVTSATRTGSASEETERARRESYLAKADLGKRFTDADLRALGVQTSGLGQGAFAIPFSQGFDKVFGKQGPKAAKLVPTPDQIDANKTIAEWKKFADRLGTEISSALATSLSRGFEALFANGGGLKSGFKAMTGALIEGLGDMFERVGESALVGLSFMQKIKDAILTFSPEIGIAAALGLIALGAAMKGAGARIVNGSGGVGGAGSYGSTAPGTIVDRGLINPTGPSNSGAAAGIQARPSIVFAPTLLGAKDPTVLRTLDEMLRALDQRGRL
jgi:hypothetical protein